MKTGAVVGGVVGGIVGGSDRGDREWNWSAELAICLLVLHEM